MQSAFLRDVAFWTAVVAAGLAVMFIGSAAAGFGPGRGYIYAVVVSAGGALFGGIVVASLERLLRGLIDSLRGDRR